MYGCESWTIKKAEHWRIDAFELWCWRRLLRVPWTARRFNQSILKEISPGCSLEGLMLKLKLQYFGHLMRRTVMTNGKTIALIKWTFVGKVMSLLFNMLSRSVIIFLPRSKHLLISWLQSQSAVIHSSSSSSSSSSKSLQSCLTLCDLIDGSPSGFPVPGILQARKLEWIAISFSNAWKWKVKVKSLSRVRLLATPRTSAYQAPPSMGFSRQEYWSGVPLPSLGKCK